MSDIEKTLEFFVEYYNKTRQVGHTSAALNGAIIQGAIIIAHSEQMVKCIVDNSCNQADSISLDYLEDLVGHEDPIIFDNEALRILFSEALAEIRRLKCCTNTGTITSANKTITVKYDGDATTITINGNN